MFSHLALKGHTNSAENTHEMKGLATLLLFFLFSISGFTSTLAADTLAANQNISDNGQTIVSGGGSFAMGFFSPGSNNTRRYFGIWFNKISKGRVVWVANREVPITDNSGVLHLNERGILILSYQNNTNVVWSSNTSRQAQSGVAQLLDSGNLVVRNENDISPGNYFWQSFEHPGNTFLPGMKVGQLAPGFDVIISAWKSTDNPSQSINTFEIDPKGFEIVVKTNSSLRSRSGPWNGIGFSGLPYLKPDPLYNYSFVYNQNQVYFTFQLIDLSVVSTLFLNENGIMQRETWINRTSSWLVYQSAPVDNCDNYGICGVYGSCDASNSPVCGCLERFVPRNAEQWGRADWSSGCVRKTPLDCKNGDGFILYNNLKLPDTANYTRNESMSLEQCRVACLNNCSCMGYTSADIRYGSGCMRWFGDLIDIRQYTTDGQSLYIRMASSEVAALARTGSNSKTKVGIIVGVVVAALLLLGLGLCLFARKKRHQKRFTTDRSRRNENISEEYSAESYQDEDLGLPYFDLTTIAQATGNFSFINLLGEGGFGPVYKGTLKDGQEIAVKRLSKESKQGVNEFKNEVKCIAKLQHRNLVKLLGYCIHLDEKILVYEYMPNKSLDFYICDQTQSKLLDWSKRMHIIHGISRGLLYLHQDSRLRIIHRDLKLSNILLDYDMNPKISDFGLARIFGGNETAANTRRVVGTYGYMSPEYAIDGLFSIKSDVFSFGVLVLEIISGRKNRGFTHPEHQLNLVGHAWKLFKEGRPMELVDTLFVESCNISEVLRTIHVGLLCVQHNPEDRPTMSMVVLMLSGEGTLPDPKEPGFFTERKFAEASSSSSKPESVSINDVTVTLISAR
ncbi:hypothetical protein Tsubulata_005428 [Turnera subulata]|uniref:Receptor-like serine/threonine-protein kinase n=1 Tax=Turnera subulata TaxID=218843 RepID=A0A9Q0JIK2_9ROSI|nr:hypothetical protein Tsubulata_005428 [Turnera subulata]